MEYGQVIANGLMLGALYACIAVGFSLVWGVLNVINMLHGSFIILGGYLTFFAWLHLPAERRDLDHLRSELHVREPLAAFRSPFIGTR